MLLTITHRVTILHFFTRLSTIRNADRIGVVDKGKIRELGTHSELMALNGRYARLVALQDLDNLQVGTVEEKKDHIQSVEPGAAEKETKEERGEGENEKEQEKAFAARARTLASEVKNYFLIGSVGAILAGLVFPGWGVAFGYMIEVLYTSVLDCDESNPVSPFPTCDDYFDDVASDMRRKAREISFGYVGLTLSTLVGSTLLYWGFGNASERINKRVRDSAFTNIVRQEIAWFDMRNPGKSWLRVRGIYF